MKGRELDMDMWIVRWLEAAGEDMGGTGLCVIGSYIYGHGQRLAG